MARNDGIQVNGLKLTDEQLRALAQQKQQEQQIVVAAPMNDVQNISICAALMAASGYTSADPLLDLATDLVAGAMARVVDGRFRSAVESAQLRAQAEASNLLAST
jgi:hypothetical protein